MNRRQWKKNLLDGKKLLKKPDFLPLLFLSIVFFLLPGQNDYQTLEVVLGKPLFQKDVLALPTPADYPKNLERLALPILTSRAVVVIDVDSGVVLYERNRLQVLPPASTTKIMTAMVALENYPLEQIIEVKNLEGITGQVMGLKESERISVKNLLYGLLVLSGNDAAEILAGNYPLGRIGFIEQMNTKAKALNLRQTHFQNPAGIEEENHVTSAFDLALLAQSALKNSLFAEMVATKEIVVTDETGMVEHQLKNVNRLLGELWGLRGVKTGWTENAGECLVAYLERSNRKVLTVVLGSQDRFGETEKLVNWIFNNFSWQKITPEAIGR